jgi:cell division protein FtsB
MENKQSNKSITVVLVILLLAAIGYAFYSDSQHSALQAELEAEKTEIKSELDQLIVKYDAKIAENTTLNTKLSAARQDIILYRDSLKAEKKASYATIKRYKRRVYSLSKKNKELFRQVEELTSQNHKLNEEVVAAKVVIENQEVAGAELKARNRVLSDKVDVAAKLTVDNLTVASMKKRSSGSLKATSKAKYTDAFRVSFKIDQNLLAENGDKTTYIVITDSEGEVVAPKGKLEGTSPEAYYSDMTTISYQNIDTEVIIITDVNRKENKKGLYTISAMLDGEVVGNTELSLR